MLAGLVSAFFSVFLFGAVAVVVCAAFIPPLYEWWEERKHRDVLLADRCLCCEDVVRPDDAGHYACAGCGFTPAMLVGQANVLRELRSGIDEFREARWYMRRALRKATLHRFALTNVNGKYTALERASEHMMLGYDLVRKLAAQFPELLEIPDPQACVDPNDAGVDAEVGGMLGAVLQFGVRKRIRDGIAHGLRELDAAIAVSRTLASQEIQEAAEAA